MHWLLTEKMHKYLHVLYVCAYLHVRVLKHVLWLEFNYFEICDNRINIC